LQDTVKPHACRSWLSQEHAILSLNKRLSGPTFPDALIHGVLRNLLFCSSTASLTPTFYLDLDRLRIIRIDLRNLICHSICGAVLMHVLDPEMSRCGATKAFSTLCASLTAIVGPRGLWTEHIESIATEIVRTALAHAGRPFLRIRCRIDGFGRTQAGLKSNLKNTYFLGLLHVRKRCARSPFF
jgi:hypothetical protein